MNFFLTLLTILIIFTSVGNICIYLFIDKPPGLRGEKGNKGDKGEMGPIGLVGDTGPPGDTGPNGDKGPVQGLIGKLGPKGDIGPRGLPGEDGFEGLRGYTGEKGPPGIKGEKGPDGKKGRVGKKGPPRIYEDNEDIRLIAYRDKCLTIKANDNPSSFKCPDNSNMAVFDIKASKITNDGDDMKIEEVTCCNFGLFHPTLMSKYNGTEVTTKFTNKIAQLDGLYTRLVNDIIIEETAEKLNPIEPKNDIEKKEKEAKELSRKKTKKILNNIKIINFLLTPQRNMASQEYLYPLRLLFQLRNDELKLIEEIEKFPKNNIEELENYLKIE